MAPPLLRDNRAMLLISPPNIALFVLVAHAAMPKFLVIIIDNCGKIQFVQTKSRRRSEYCDGLLGGVWEKPYICRDKNISRIWNK